MACDRAYMIWTMKNIRKSTAVKCEDSHGRGLAEDYIKAIQSHGWKICSDVEPQERMEKVLYTIDELTGLIVATVLMRRAGALWIWLPSQ